MHLGAVTVTGINAGATSTMIVIFRFVVPAIDGKLTILRKFMSVLARSVFAVFILTLIGILGITAPIMGICACCFNTVPRERQKFCVHGIIGARQTGASNEHEHQTQFS